MLHQRVLTALILIGVVLALIFHAPGWVFQLSFALIAWLGMWEWLRLVGVTRLPVLAGWMLIGSLLLAGAYYAPWFAVVSLALAALLYWLSSLISLLRFPASGGLLGWVYLQPLAGLLTLAITWLTLVRLHQGASGPALLLLLLVLVWSADTGAFFTGRAFGRTKLLPKVSPGKTVEGFLGGLLLALSAGVFGGWMVGYRGAALGGFLLVGAGTIGLSVIGDLAESMVKRARGVKDSGHWLPGHGGILDRIDSLQAAAPGYFLGVFLLGGVF